MSECDDDIEDFNDATWAQQEQLERQMLEDDPGYVEFLKVFANQFDSTQLGD